ncbi:MAG: gliding motility-associated ABC transporter permease subunit GldF [Bacteroidia bacterium]|nr:gliding motility-associated ABC transporter permease subunit GldF [Bacteroidia bacterium]
MGGVIAIFRKEVAAFFNSLIAYMVIGVFLTGVGLFFWMFEYNILETGMAQLDALFDYGPYMFLFLAPAITMRAFSEEIKSGTLEFLATKPLTPWQLILGKYLAAAFLVLFALIPTLIYVASVYWLGDPVGNLDTGATWGAYIGLFLLGCIFAAIGLFTSALTDNQIVAFILGTFLCFFFFIGLDFLAGIKALDLINTFFLKLGIIEHYRSISRGVIDTRDVLYFVSVVSVALIGARIALQRRLR